MRKKPSNRPFRKRYILIQWEGEGDEVLVKRKINHALRKHGGKCPGLTKARPWIWLIEFNSPYGIVRVPHTCADEAKEVLNGIEIHSHTISTHLTSGTLKTIREKIAGMRQHLINIKRSRDKRR